MLKRKTYSKLLEPGPGEGTGHTGLCLGGHYEEAAFPWW